MEQSETQRKAPGKAVGVLVGLAAFAIPILIQVAGVDPAGVVGTSIFELLAVVGLGVLAVGIGLMGLTLQWKRFGAGLAWAGVLGLVALAASVAVLAYALSHLTF
ncbi:hypothetical protein AB5J62_41275 [Amycolatopsis sp. cg5]|uniref:hypothetical protein n=1 Tax=Amycolatopsis sp. cg5 TaxID=3238802 RepID=UPI003525BF72